MLGSDPPRPHDRPSRGRTLLGLALLALVFALAMSIFYAWQCDDAFISHRYARNLVRGEGLVFNPGERVEGYTNLLWVLWTALGLVLGAAPELWTTASGIACYLASLALLALFREGWVSGERGVGATVPIAALLGAVDADWSVWATSGLETSALTFAFVLGFVLLAAREPNTARSAAAGFVLGASFLLRPDGILLGAIGLGYVAWRTLPRWIPLVAYSAASAAVMLPAMFWRFAYYGDLFPNTYYAKLAYLPRYGQGLVYLATFAIPHFGVLLAALVAVGGMLLAWWHGGRRLRAVTPSLALSLGFATVYTLYVVRVGGDFMYARLLVPTIPFWLVLAEAGLLRAFAQRRRTYWGLMACIALTPILTHVILARPFWFRGITNEHFFYTGASAEVFESRARDAARFLGGLPLRVVIFGTEARLAYRADVSVVIEGHGLTDAVIAHGAVDVRGRPGHEHWASPDYLLNERGVHLLFSSLAYDQLELEQWIPRVEAKLGSLDAFVLNWDPAIIEDIRRRGGTIADFPAELDRYIATLGQVPTTKVREDLERFRCFYFRHVEDPARLRAFEERLKSD